MTKRYPAGSEWRKWDLHVHIPGTKLSDGYDRSSDDTVNWDRAADIIEKSDVAVVGITDYFSVENTYGFIEFFRGHYPQSEKLLLANLELRLNETVNGAAQNVDFHVLFSNTVAKDQVKRYLSHLKTQMTDGNDRKKSCSELTGNDYEAATVTRDDLTKAFVDTFGPKAEPTDYLIYLAPANNNGLRAERRNQRKANLADNIDKLVHAIFGKDADNTSWYLKTDRYEDSGQESKAKPVFGGSDAHNFADLEAWLGKALENESTRQVITWVKADPTFAGLQQTLVEPKDRVSIAELKPDAKDDYKVIKKVTFSGSADFPEEIVFNPNLNAIIGSRSSGKSALLAHIAHAVDPSYTVSQQSVAAGSKTSERELGPASGISWSQVSSTVCTVEWANGSIGGDGQVIYIPQNWLYQISDNPKEVTDKIQPVLESHFESYFREHERQLGAVKTANAAVEKSVGRWFELAESLKTLDAEIKELGSKKSVTDARDKIAEEIAELRSANSLSEPDLEKYQTVTNDIDAKKARQAEIEVEAEQLDRYVLAGGEGPFSTVPNMVSAETYLTPDIDNVPPKLRDVLVALVAESDRILVGKVEEAIAAYRNGLSTESVTLENGVKVLQQDNRELIDKHTANATLDELVKRQKAQQAALDKIEKLEARRTELQGNQKASAEDVKMQIQARASALESLVATFSSDARELDQLTFGVALGLDPDTVRALSQPFNKNEKGAYLKVEGDEQLVDVDKAQGDPQAFMDELFSKRQKLNKGNQPIDITKQVLGATAEIRFTAQLEGDSIGGFERSTMTPGKRALLALTLILGEAEDQWALLIDQPEDDLDSRSIYREIVQYLVKQKKQRQIILVTHNANLVVGADAEEILVANRHGDDRKNKDDRTFDYLTGALEHSEPRKVAAHDLDRMGIREHAVEILDGGEEAFQKRRDKYKI
ncbi:MAG: TrlF family AAA-like ATPase [Ferrimicrobium sp.]